MRLLWDNEIDKYMAFYSSQKSNFPATNTKHIHLSSPWRTTAVTGQYYTIDAGDGKTITADCAVIVGKTPDYSHNFTSGATAKIQAHPTNTWISPDLDQAFTWNKDSMIVFFTQTTKRFWRFYFNDASNPNGYLNIPRLFLCTYYQVDKSFQKDFPEEKIDSSRVTESPSGQPYTDEGIIRRRYTLQFPYWASAAKQAIENVADTVGKKKPVVVVLDENNMDKLPVLHALIESDQSYGHIHNYIWKGSLVFQEVF